ncbi:hypothetical protein B296_00031081, partial [Ensete ventricosum]
VLVEYRNKDVNHVEWAKALKELYLPSLRDYVKSFYPLGLTWASAGSAVVSSSASAPVAKDPPSQAPVPPPPPSASLFTSEAASSRPKEGISAVFQEIGTGKSDVVAACEIVNCNGVEVQCQISAALLFVAILVLKKVLILAKPVAIMVITSIISIYVQGSAPTISVDNTSGCQLYLSKDSLGASITTAKSSEINVMVPGAGPESDWVRLLL